MKTAHRNASRAKRQQLPKFWVRPTSEATQTTLRVLHWDILTQITNGSATVDTLREWIAIGLTYSRMLWLLESEGLAFTPEARAALAEQLQQQPAVLRRYQATGRIGFTGPEYMTARAAACVVDDLLTHDRNACAVRAAEWSEQQLLAMQNEFSRGNAAPTHHQPEITHV